MKKVIQTWLLTLAGTGMAAAQGPAPMPVETTAVPCVAEPVMNCGPTVWASADYLLWWCKDAPRPGPLVSTGTTADPFPGALDQASTRVLSGNQAIGLGTINGGRARIGMWLDRNQLIGVELGGMLLEQVARGESFVGDANGQPFLGRPFTNALTGNPNVYFVSQNFADPTISAFMTGRLDIITQSRFWAWEANATINLSQSATSSLVGIVGFKSMDLDERLVMDETIRNLVPGGGSFFNGASTLPTQTVKIVDDFRTTNRFYGGQVGARYSDAMGSFVFDVAASCALGVTRQEQTIIGTTTLFNGTTPGATLPGGVLALNTNSGTSKRDVFSVVPEANVNVGYRLTSWLTARVGYSFLYWSDVARPTQQLDFAVNPNRVPSDAAFGTPGGPNRPTAQWQSTDYWLHGVNFGLDFRW